MVVLYFSAPKTIWEDHSKHATTVSFLFSQT